jgi:hypothetical protein
MRASEIAALERYKDQSYGGPMTSYETEGSWLQRLPTYLPPGVGPLTWPVSLPRIVHLLYKALMEFRPARTL